MTPFKPEERKKLVDAAAKAFPKKSRNEIEQEFGQMLELQTRTMFGRGQHTPDDKQKLERLENQFFPKS